MKNITIHGSSEKDSSFPIVGIGASVTVPKSENALKKIFILLRAQTSHDFSQYKPSTIHRRIERRMAVNQIDTLDGYVKFVQQSPGEVEALFRDLLIGVTNFFRDPEAFQTLEAHGIPKLFADKSPDTAIRVWTPGCSTGEEAYSIAILLQEHMESLKQSYTVQIFATDIDSQAIATARSGRYPASIAADISPERLARFFTADPDGSAYRINKSIRDMLIFSEQDLVKDPPFSKLDFISCRNLLIYMGGDLQKKIIPLFHYALKQSGMLFLGTSETIGDFVDLFAPVDRKFKLYQRKGDIHDTQRITAGRFVPTATPVDAGLSRNVGKAALSAKRPLRELTEQAQSASLQTPATPGVHDSESEVHIAALKQELRAKEEYLQAANEELETSNEELKSSNEEMQSVNEELQSTNEELETSKEELQSVNEELATVNTELQTKVADLSQVNNDMNNLLAGTGIGTVFVDHHLRILRFTPSVTRIINLIPSDVGRPVAHIVSNLISYDRLVADAQIVLDTLIPREIPVQTTTGAWYTMRILPYRTLENVIEGVVITFFDITEMKHAEKSLKRSETLLRTIQRLTRIGGWEWDVDSQTTYWTDEMYYLHDFIPGEFEPGTESIAQSLSCYLPEDRPVLQAALQLCSEKGIPYDFDFDFTTAKGRRLRVRTLAEPVWENGRVVRVVGFIMDITDSRQYTPSEKEMP